MSKMHLMTNCAAIFLATVAATAAPSLTSTAQPADVGGFLGGAGAEPVRPPLIEGEPEPGKFVRQQSPEFRGSGVYHGLYLPTNWQPGHSYPVIVEYAPNRWEAFTGKVDDCRLGFYLSGGRDFIWLVLPYVDPVKQENVVWWWGSEDATIEYCLTNLRRTCEQYGGDANAVLFTGFSRGAIAAGYLALRNETIADVWLGFLPHSHIDGGRFTSDGARERLARTRGRPTFITYGSDDDGKNESPKGARILRELGFPVVERELEGLEHTDRFLDTDSPIRREMREWIADVLKRRPGTWTVRGRVVDAAGKGVADVAVQCGTWHYVLTDPEGRFAIASLTPGVRTLTASKSGMTFTIPNPEITVADCDVEVNPITAQTASEGNRDFRVGVAQPLVIPGETQTNARNMEPLVIEAARRNAKLVVFSECGVTGYDLKGAGANAAITLEDPVLNQIADMARKHEIAIVTGFYEKRGESLYNSAAVFFPDGRRVVQRKHNVVAPEKAIAPITAAERDRVIFEIDGVKCALLICADAGIPGIFDELSLAGCDVVLLICAGAGDESFGMHQAELADPARRKSYAESIARCLDPAAIEQCLRLDMAQVACNQAGWSPATGYFHPGGSSIINRTGEVTAVIPSNIVFELLRPELAVGVITPRRKETKE